MIINMNANGALILVDWDQIGGLGGICIRVYEICVVKFINLVLGG